VALRSAISRLMRWSSSSYPATDERANMPLTLPLRVSLPLPGRAARGERAGVRGGCGPRSPRICQVGEIGQKVFVIPQRIGGCFRHERGAVPERRVVQQLDMVPLAVETRAHVEKSRQEARRHLVLQSPPEWPSAGRIHIDRVDIGDEDVDGTPQRY